MLVCGVIVCRNLEGVLEQTLDLGYLGVFRFWDLFEVPYSVTRFID